MHYYDEGKMKFSKSMVSKKKWLPVILCVFFMSALSAPCFGAGYGIYEWGTRGNALGGALIGRADDPSALAYNPAGITQLPGIQTMAGMTVITPTIDINFENSANGINGEATDNTWLIPNAYYTHQLNDTYWLGFGVFSRAGLGTEFENEEEYAGRYNCTYAGVKSLSFNPNLAVKLTDHLSFAAGVEADWLDFSYDKFTNATGDDVKIEVRADGWNYGYNFALHYKPSERLAFGASFRSEIALTVDGDADYTAMAGASPLTEAWVSALKSNTGVGGTEPIPQLVSLGVMFSPVDRLTVEVDAVHTKWSAYNQLTFEFENSLGSRTSIKGWEDTWRFQVGLEYALFDWLDLQAGYVNDESPIPDEYVDYAVPANDRQIYTVGASFHRNQWTYDISCAYLTVKDRYITGRTWDNDNVYDATFENGGSKMIGVSASCAF